MTEYKTKDNQNQYNEKDNKIESSDDKNFINMADSVFENSVTLNTNGAGHIDISGSKFNGPLIINNGVPEKNQSPFSYIKNILSIGANLGGNIILFFTSILTKYLFG